MYKIDLHTHSSASPDGGISEEQYLQILENETLHAIAITDHNTTELAQRLHRVLGDKIIIGEEIATTEGEIIGLFLTDTIAGGQSVEATLQAIKAQNGLVYIPHPFESVRHGLPPATVERIAAQIDIMEVYNGRAFLQNRGPQAATWARLHQKACAASSDAHGYKGLGSVYSLVQESPTRDTLLAQLAQCHHAMRRPPLLTLLYPKAHRLRNKLKASRT